ncbi:hypothetical protein BpHYR1_047284, partial [Brachionus plicatilis]
IILIVNSQRQIEIQDLEPYLGQDKFKPIFDVPYIIKSQTISGNYVLTDLKEDELKDSFPRWRLKLIEQFDKNKIIDYPHYIDKIEKI